MTATRDSLFPGELRALHAYVLDGSVKAAAHRLARSESTIKNQLNTARRATGLTTEQLIYVGARDGWLVIAELDPIGRTSP